MQLPDSLQPWREWLEWFAPELVPTLGELLGRLNPLLGPMREQHSGGQPEPDGLGDLQRRGPYERLLASEWLLADELPDEFLRRAAGGEHLFLAPRYQARHANRLIIALFDAGPRQLGAPRLAHLAMLILLARRARQAGGELRWGILQSPGKLQPVESAAHLKSLLKARTFEVVGPDYCRDWGKILDEQALEPGECWIIGQHLPSDLAQALRCSHSLALTPSLDGTALELEISQRLGKYRLALPLPAKQAAIDLLSGKFKDEAPIALNQLSADRVALTRTPTLSNNGSRIAIPLLDKPGALVIQLPSLRRQESPPKIHKSQWSGYQQPLAIAFAGQALGAMIGSGEKLCFWQLRGLNPAQRPPREELLIPSGTATLLPCAWLKSGQGARLYALDKQGRLVFWVSANYHPAQVPAPGMTHLLDEGVLGFAALPNGEELLYLRRYKNQLQLLKATPRGKSEGIRALGSASTGSQVLFSGGTLWNKGFGALAINEAVTPQEVWHLYLSASSTYESIQLPPRWRAIGLYRPQDKHQAFFVLLGADKQSISLFLDGENQVLYTAPTPAAKVVVCPTSAQVVILTETRELIVYSLVQRRLRLHLHCNQATGEEDRDD